MDWVLKNGVGLSGSGLGKKKVDWVKTLASGFHTKNENQLGKGQSFGKYH